MTTGDATRQPSANATFSVSMNGSAGLVKTRRPPGRYGAMGRLRTSMISILSSSHQPTTVTTRIATRLHRMRQRSSSRWSRNGISPRGVIVGGTARRLRSETLLILPREIGLGRARIARDHPRVEVPGCPLVSPLFGEDTLFVERRRSARRIGIGTHELIVHRCRGIGCRLLEALSDVVHGVRRALMCGEDAEELPEPQARGRDAAAPVLLQRQVVHLIGARTGGIAGWTDRSACRGIWISLLGPRLDP